MGAVPALFLHPQNTMHMAKNRSGNPEKMAISSLWRIAWPLAHFVVTDMSKPHPSGYRATEGKYEGLF
ncbi:hypothetical protein ACQUQQ_08355 [Acidithiobacillus ferrooxidans]|uniref:hypothetical protein n=1 Tax=Acidithiobacillus ferrooxidans TaxID=920 RepID=UPI000A557F6B